MFDAPPATEAPDAPVTPAQRRAEARVRRLQRMADLGLDIGERLQQQAELASTYADTEAVPDNLPHSRRLDEIARSFAQVSRAVGVLTALEDRIDNGLPALPFEDRARKERHAADKRAAATRAVLDDADAVLGPLSPRRTVAFRLSLERLLDRELADLDRFLERPFDEILARVRRDLGLGDEDDDPSPLHDPSPVRGRVTSDGPQGGPYAIANDLAIAARNAAAQAEAGPVAERREDGVTDAGRRDPPPQPVLSTPQLARPKGNHLPPSASRSSRADLSRPSPDRGRIIAPP